MGNRYMTRSQYIYLYPATSSNEKHLQFHMGKSFRRTEDLNLKTITFSGQSTNEAAADTRYCE